MATAFAESRAAFSFDSRRIESRWASWIPAESTSDRSDVGM